MKRITLTLFLVCISLSSFATLVQWRIEDGGNDHWYDVVVGKMTWYDAKSDAYSKLGYLATITCVEENTFITENVLSQIPDGYEFWIGGIQPEQTLDETGWEWVTGENWDYTNWASGEPSNHYYGDGLHEDAVEIFGCGDPENRLGQWNDFGSQEVWMGTIGTYGYVIEYVPEPATLSLLVLGGLALLRRRK